MYSGWKIKLAQWNEVFVRAVIYALTWAISILARIVCWFMRQQKEER